MIVMCPSCHNKYSVQADAIGDGKLVRCVICGKIWKQEAARKFSSGAFRIDEAVKWTFFLSIVLISLFLLIFAKSAVVKIWPPASSFYELFKREANAKKKVFQMGNISNFFVQKDGKLYIGLKGELTNTSNEVQILPSITISLKDDDNSPQKVVRFKKIWTHDMVYRKILPNQKVTFETELQSIPCRNLVCDLKLDVL